MDKIYHGRDVLKRQIAEELGYAEKVPQFRLGRINQRRGPDGSADW